LARPISFVLRKPATVFSHPNDSSMRFLTRIEVR
jgi:hypothetical protein